MSSSFFDMEFRWAKDLNGFRIDGNAHLDSGVLTSDPMPLDYLSGRLIRLGGRLQTYEPTKVSNLLLRFMQVRTPGELLRFVNLYGPLTIEGFVSERGEPFYDANEEIRWTPEEGEELEPGLEEADWFRYLAKNKARASIVAQAVERYRSVHRFEVMPDKRKGVRLVVVPKSLLDLLRLQLVQMLIGSPSYSECGYCGEFFAKGVGTARRADAEFCSDDHRIKFNSRKRSL
jgi:hypothetical protein